MIFLLLLVLPPLFVILLLVELKSNLVLLKLIVALRVLLSHYENFTTSL